MATPFQPRTVIFSDYPQFTPNLSPREIFEQGAFGGTYWRKIYSRVTGQTYEGQWQDISSLVAMVQEDPNKQNLLDQPLTRFNVKLNKYKAKSGSTLEEWENNGWINPQDPYGWVQWYCKFYYGRRTADDARQIERWENFTGPNGRFKRNLINKVLAAGTTYDDPRISPVIRQGLHQWAYCLTASDLQ